MIDTLQLYNDLKESLEPKAAESIAAVIGRAYDDLQSAVTKEDFSGLRSTVQELAEAQKRTELQVEELAEAQKRTEKEVAKLSIGLQDLRKQVGGLSHAVGYGLEDEIMKYMPAFARKEYGISTDALDRRFVEYDDGLFDEVNLFLKGRNASGNLVYLIGECKAQPGKKDAARFSGTVKRLEAVLDGEVFGILVGYQFRPEVEAYVRGKYSHLRLMKTFEFKLYYPAVSPSDLPEPWRR